MSVDIVITPARRDDLPEIQRLAHDIWHAHYPGIITREQIGYMLERGYATGVLEEFIDGPDSGIQLALADGLRVGFAAWYATGTPRSEEHTSELQSRPHLVCRLLLE